ncbi:hypothetical protein RJ641_023156 [Dillenia turbinata]|uniref:Uncharacterized protein n=1 Tax=Dillenia turbinata TaxID=194707 RepID=A0AAN8UDP5_9MAGN
MQFIKWNKLSRHRIVKVAGSCCDLEKGVYEKCLQRIGSKIQWLIRSAAADWECSIQTQVHPVFPVSFLKPYHENLSGEKRHIVRDPPTIQEQFEKEVEETLMTHGRVKRSY